MSKVSIQVLARPELTARGEVWAYRDSLLAVAEDGRIYSAKVPAIGAQPKWERFGDPPWFP